MTTPVNVGDEGRAPDRFDGAYVTANGVRVAGVSPIIGRAPWPTRTVPARRLSSLTWRERLGVSDTDASPSNSRAKQS